MTDVETARRYYRQREARRRAQREAERQYWLQRARQVISHLAPDYPGVRQAALFGSLVKPGQFRPGSDIDVAIDCGTPETESAFWRALERELGRDVDVRPLTGTIAETVAHQGELVYG
jgi:predicted nucleotidyltransferase